VSRQIEGLEKEYEEKEDKTMGIKNIVDSFNKEGLVQLFTREIEEDEIRIFQYEQFQKTLAERAQ
jgi:hypothetical protein